VREEQVEAKARAKVKVEKRQIRNGLRLRRQLNAI
jgi:hypothetical protein